MPETEEQRILLTQALPGMVLGRPVVNAEGVALCGTGSELTDLLIHKLTIRGIKRITVQGHPVSARPHEPLEERLRKLHHRFSRVSQVPLMRTLERIIALEISRHAR